MKRGRQIATVFSMQGIGITLAPIVVLLLLLMFGKKNLDLVWRFALGLGALPGILMLYSRIRMKETTQFSNTSRKKLPLLFIIKKYWRKLLGTASTWLILDITFYANGLFNATMVSLFITKDAEDHYSTLVQTTGLTIGLALIGLPGYFTAVFLIDIIGRRNLQLIGFACLGIVYLLMGLLFDRLINVTWTFVILYGLTFFFSNAGPNTVTFVVPSELFPTQVRATCHGISAAAGKIGAAIGAASIEPIFLAYGMNTALISCACVAFVGFIFTWFFLEETMGKPLQEEPIYQEDDFHSQEHAQAQEEHQEDQKY